MWSVEGDKGRSSWGVALAGAGALALAWSVGDVAGRGTGQAQAPLPTTVEDFFQPGTQPSMLVDSFLDPSNCAVCHANYDDGLPGGGFEPYDTWVTSMMAQAARDPVWHAALAIANQDAQFSGEYCIRCHAPNAWLNGRSGVADLSKFVPQDFQGIFCHVCHRLVNPVLGADSPPEDVPIVQDLMGAGLLPAQPGNARYVIDPVDTRRGPFDDVPINMHPAPIVFSPFHRESVLCATCHDVSNPAFTRQPDGTYVLNALNAPHPTQDPNEMFPEQRTFSEWSHSQFASGGVFFGDGRFGGNHATGIMESCQDCHVPDQFAGGCFAWESPPFFPRPDLPAHRFSGANTWVLNAVYDLDGAASGLTPTSIADARALVVDMLRAASDLRLRQIGDTLLVRIINYAGHKLPTGYPEGRRMWINAQFFDAGDALIAERGAYDPVTAILTTADTKVYEAVHTIDDTVAAMTGLPAGAHGHLAVNNVIEKDNRIPPIGFTNAAFASVLAEPVAATYADGQHWDDTSFVIPAGAVRAVVTVYYQTTSREFMDFLRDANVTNQDGQIAHDQWVLHGQSSPVDMDALEILFTAGLPGDLDGSGTVDVLDLLMLLTAWGPCPPPEFCEADLNNDGAIDVLDLLILLGGWS